jgi:dTMP kinase
MFVTFEGPEGSGKSTQIALLVAFLCQEGLQVVSTREPGGTAIGDQIRDCLHDVDNQDMSAEAEILLYSASRAQLVRQVIMPAIGAGQLVLCDRFYDSTLAYQGYGRGLDLGVLQQITRFATGGLRPDLTILLDLDVRAGLARRTKGGEEMNRLDQESLTFHQRVRRGYHRLVAQEPERWVVVDAAQPADAVRRALREVARTRILGI